MTMAARAVANGGTSNPISSGSRTYAQHTIMIKGIDRKVCTHAADPHFVDRLSLVRATPLSHAIGQAPARHRAARIKLPAKPPIRPLVPHPPKKLNKPH